MATVDLLTDFDLDQDHCFVGFIAKVASRYGDDLSDDCLPREFESSFCGGLGWVRVLQFMTWTLGLNFECVYLFFFEKLQVFLNLSENFTICT